MNVGNLGFLGPNDHFGTYTPSSAAAAPHRAAPFEWSSTDRVEYFAEIVAALHPLDNGSLAAHVVVEEHASHHSIISPLFWELHSFSLDGAW